MKWIIIGLLCFLSHNLLSQDRKTRNNYTGDWETPASWDPNWFYPQTDVMNSNITIYGYITAKSSLSFSGSSKLIVDDTLVIKGDLTINHDNDLQVNQNGILIVWGNLIFSNKSDVTAYGYIIVTGDLIKDGSSSEGGLDGTEDPAMVFIGGGIYPAELTDDNSDFELLDCTSPSDPYPYSGCNYGNMEDLMNDPVYSFFLSTCPTNPAVIAGSNNPVCSGDAINLTAAGGISYSWSGPDGFTSEEQNPSRPVADIVMAGIYTVVVTSDFGCLAELSTEVTVHPAPSLVVTDPLPVCYPATVDLTGPDITAGSTGGLTWSYYADAEGTTILESPGEATSGTYYIRGTTAEGCHDIKPVTVTVHPAPSLVVTDPLPVCYPATVDLTGPDITAGSTGGLAWSYYADAEGTTILESPGEATSGTYYIRGTTAEGCHDIKPVTVKIEPLPMVSITGNNSMCIDEQIVLEGIPAGGTFLVTSGPGNISDNLLRAFRAGDISVEYHYTDACFNMAEKIISVDDFPVADAGLDQELTFIFNVRMQATLLPFETGKWTLVSGSGRIQDSHSPTTLVYGLSLGDNIFLWTVQNESCKAEKEVNITVNDLFIPSVITPNNDGKNDYFSISPVDGPVELIIFNRWGLIEYENKNYNNNWDGRNRSGMILPNDTYFYILKFENGITRTGTVLIKR